MTDFPQANPRSLNPTQIFQGFGDSTKNPSCPVEQDQISLPKKKKRTNFPAHPSHFLAGVNVILSLFFFFFSFRAFREKGNGENSQIRDFDDNFEKF